MLMDVSVFLISIYKNIGVDIINPVKLGLALISGIYDIILMYQHFIAYRPKSQVIKDKQTWVQMA